MQFLFDALTTLLIGYLALTNALALMLTNLFVDDFENSVETSSVGESAPTALPSLYAGTMSLPDILLRSAEFQTAAVIDSTSAPLVIDPARNPIDALVNVYCTFITPDTIRTTTGTGFFVANSGIILTNAHVAQFLLLEKTTKLGQTNCVIRNGNPAAPRYNAELLYISPAWVKENAVLVSVAAPTGTGERDYALLYVTSAVDESPLPASFPALRVSSGLLSRSYENTGVTAVAYPAGDMLSGGSDTELIPRMATTSITQLFTFTSNVADVIGLRGSIIGQQGSSGGPIIDSKANVIGMITTRGNDARDGAGSLRAITLSHVNRTITEETGFSLENNLRGNIPYRAEVFTTTMVPFLTQQLTDSL
jgi:S1-C subfamily serine protease